ncbi:hypothetical protein SLS64_010510 [Diaporthe eres]|uniref:Uncharacterized protein n=1 Tax=Diaporthe eres TaxID=83184 RepID=A0ABR1PEF7_DIAER
MASIGRFAFAGVSTAVEVTNALASINVDFSLVKIDPPQEFRDVGQILGAKRRDTAEDGTLHITARRLGAIFESILPQTPQLIKSYGLRASEIARSSVEKSPASKGIFAQQTGIDAASIWAGATSGSGAIQVHLLACMLARMWTGPEATSIWAELLNCRRMRLEDEFRSKGTMDMRTMVAAKQQIDRAQLAEWDASARAWLRIADIAKNLQHKQLLLILGNLDKAVNSKPVLYDSVINAWTTGMEGMEALLQGSPMMMQAGDMALALSSWHIYPDLNIVSSTTKMVHQKDSLVPPSGILTIGLERHDSGSHKGLQWSLPLAHLRYYGDPVTRVSELTIQGSRLSLLEFDMAVLGCVLGGWDIPDRDDTAAIKWISKLPGLMTRAYPGESARLEHTWLRILGKTASAYLGSTDMERRRFTKLLHLGRGRRSFISDRNPPFFGLSSLDRVIRMVKIGELRVSILRAQAHKANIPFEHAIIRYFSDTTGQEEFASAAPRRRAAPKRPNPETNPSQSKTSVDHIRWVHQGSKYLLPQEDAFTTPLNHGDTYPGVMPSLTDEEMEELEDKANAEKVASIIAAQKKAEQAFQNTKRLYENMGEQVLPSEGEPIETYARSDNRPTRVVWGQAQGAHGMDKYEHWFGPMKHYEQWIGDAQTAAIFLRLDLDPAIPGGEARISPQELQSLFDRDAIDPKAFVREILGGTALGDGGKVFVESLRAYTTMHSLYTTLNQATVDVRVLGMPLVENHWTRSILEENPSTKIGKDESERSPSDDHGDAASPWGDSDAEHGESLCEEPQGGSFQDAMEMLEVKAPETFTTFIPAVQVVDTTMEEMLPYLGPGKMTLEQYFSCILLFENIFDIAPQTLRNVMAISSGNSLFIASSLLSDPHSLPARRKISHVMGNIGRPGTVLLVPPVEPRMMAPGIERWPFMNFRDWDGIGRDSFAESSLHLWFTGSTQEVSIGYSGAQDKELYMVESVVSLHGKGEWVADLDILRALQSSSLVHRQKRSIPPSLRGQVALRGGPTDDGRRTMVCQESHDSQYRHQKLPLATIETWWELLEKSSDDCVFLAAGNWQARLAAMIICLAQGRRVSVVSNPVCWDCVADSKRTISELKDPVVYIY